MTTIESSFESREITPYELAIKSGDAFGLFGTDGSGNEWDTPQNIGNTEVEINFGGEE